MTDSGSNGMTAALQILKVDPLCGDALALLGDAAVEARGLYPELHDPHAPGPTNQPNAPRGIYLVAYLDGKPAGMAAHRPFDASTTEVRRLYVATTARRSGIARALLRRLEEHARSVGFTHLVLETGHRQVAAMALYADVGFTRIAPFGAYRDDPTSVCFRKAMPAHQVPPWPAPPPMPRRLYFISHPNVVVDPATPVPRWPLSALGKARMVEGLKQPWIRDIASIYASTEQKAVDTARILASHLSIGFTQVEDLGENDRSSTGFLQPDEFEAVADQFFANPEQSVRGWERAIDAQRRIVRAVTTIAQQDQGAGSIAIVSHGAVGTLLYCHLTGKPISRAWDQPPNGGGNFYGFTLAPAQAGASWAAIDRPAA